MCMDKSSELFYFLLICGSDFFLTVFTVLAIFNILSVCLLAFLCV